MNLHLESPPLLTHLTSSDSTTSNTEMVAPKQYGFFTPQLDTMKQQPQFQYQQQQYYQGKPYILPQNQIQSFQNPVFYNQQIQQQQQQQQLQFQQQQQILLQNQQQQQIQYIHTQQYQQQLNNQLGEQNSLTINQIPKTEQYQKQESYSTIKQELQQQITSSNEIEQQSENEENDEDLLDKENSVKCNLCNKFFQKGEKFNTHFTEFHVLNNIKKKKIQKPKKQLKSEPLLIPQQQQQSNYQQQFQLQQQQNIFLQQQQQQFQQQQFQQQQQQQYHYQQPQFQFSNYPQQQQQYHQYHNNQQQQFIQQQFPKQEELPQLPQIQQNQEDSSLFQGVEKIVMQSICPKKNGNFQQIMNDTKLWKSKYQNFNKLFMLKILNIFTHSNLAHLPNLSEKVKEMLVSYAASIKLSGKRFIELNRTTANNKKVKTKKVKIDYFQNAHYLLCFLKITSRSIKKLNGNERAITLHKQIFNLDLTQQFEEMNQEQVETINFIKQAFYYIVVNCTKNYQQKTLEQNNVNQSQQQQEQCKVEQEELDSQQQNKSALEQQQQESSNNTSENEVINQQQQQQQNDTNQTVRQYAETLIDRIKQMNQGEIILRFSQ